jgi:hypothetical protein
MNPKHLQQFNTAKASIKLLYNQVQECLNYDKLNTILTLFNNTVQKQSNPKNNRPNKHIIGIGQYFYQSKTRLRSVEIIVKNEMYKHLKNKATYKDYLPEFQLLRRRGYSYRRMSDYAKQYWNISVSKDTISKYLKEAG